ncbi:hypothetical protein MINTMi198_17930 [Mycobacterium intracellulare M.i.198]|nr:hypothetical protein MINTMi198_17930 [Mycobacterium intracellulare M.i.198]
MAEQKVPSRWDVEVRVMTPDHQVLISRQTYSPDYMDRSLMEYLLGSLTKHSVECLKERGYFDGRS